MAKIIQGQLNAADKKYAIIVSRFNEFITSRLVDGALDCIDRHGGSTETVDIYRVPGSFEIPTLASHVAKTEKYDSIICLAAVIRGGTPHFEYVANEVTKGIAQVGLETGIPLIYGVLTCNSIEEAIERAGTKQGNKGWDAALSAIEMSNLLRSL